MSVKEGPELPVHNTDTGLDYATIQEAIDAAETLDGHTIFVEEGIYYEHVVVNKSVSLVGENKSTTIIDGNETDFCVKVTANNVTVTGLTVQKSARGIILDNSSVTLVSDNIVSNNNWGIYAKSDNNSIVRNVIAHNLDGIHLRGSYTTVAQNILSSNSFAIYVYMCENNTIVNNEVSKSFWGIELVYSKYLMVIGNVVSRSQNFGIGVAYGGNNTIYHNNFINNTDQVFILQTHNNTWDNGVEGNYWSNYNGVDNNQDGKGDSPHVIDANNKDNYPLMGMFSSFNTSSGYYVNVISNSTVEDFEYFESNNTIKMYVSNMTENQTFGFCRVCIPTDLMLPPYHIIIDDGQKPVLNNRTVHENETHKWIYFAYQHSTLEITIVSESPAFLIPPLFMIATLSAVIIHKRKKGKSS